MLLPRAAPGQAVVAAPYNFPSWIGWPGEDPYILPFAQPMGVAVDNSGIVYVTGYELVTYVTLTPSFWQATTLAGPGSDETGTNDETYDQAYAGPIPDL